MRRTLCCLSLTLAAFACREADERGDPAMDEAAQLDDSAAIQEAPATPRRAVSGADVIPEFRLRLDPSRHVVDASIELDLSRPDSIHLVFMVDSEAYPGLEQRLRRLEAHGSGGPLSVAKDAGSQGRGHHLVEATRPERISIRYTMELTPPRDSRLYHRASQLDGDGGHFIGADLFPRIWIGRFRGRPLHPIQLWFTGRPTTWRVATLEQRSGTGYRSENITSAVFVIGSLRTKRINVGPRSLTAAVHGAWPVPDDRVFDAVSRIAGNLHRIADDGWRAGDYLLGAGRVPADVPGLSTGGQIIREAGIVYVGGRGPAEIEFRHWMYTTAHELMHWYIPTGFEFGREPTRWFYEGFTDYMALKSLLVGGLISGQDFLAAIGERLNRYHDSPAHGTSVVEAESDFWQEDTYRYVYDAGASAAFLLDLGFQDRGASLERALTRIRHSSRVTREVLERELGAIRENRWIEDWLADGVDPDWQSRLQSYGLAWRDGTLVSLDGWATDALSSIRP